MKRLTFKHSYEHYRCGGLEPMSRVTPENDFAIIDTPVENTVRGLCRDNIGYPYSTHDRYVAGAVVDKLYQYEELGYEPEELKKIIDRYRAYRLALNSVYGKTCDLDVASLYPNQMIIMSARCNGKTQLQKAMYEYLFNDVKSTEKIAETMKFAIDNVIFNDPATIVFWCDGTKTVVKAQRGEKFDPEKGLMAAIAKKALGNEGKYYNKIGKWVKKYEKQQAAVKAALDKISEGLTKAGQNAKNAAENLAKAVETIEKHSKKKGRGLNE